MTDHDEGRENGELHNNPFADDWVKGLDGMWSIAYEVSVEGATAAATTKKQVSSIRCRRPDATLQALVRPAARGSFARTT